MKYPLLTDQREALTDVLLSRRSVAPKYLTDPGPDADTLETIMAAATTAADHCGIRPWRFIVIRGSSREALGDLFAKIKAQREPDIPEHFLERERDKARTVPVTIAIVTKLVENHPVVPLREQYASVGAAIQNILLSAHAHRFGAKMVSGRKVENKLLVQAFDLAPSEKLFGFLCIGTPESARKKTKRVTRELFNQDFVKNWNPDSTASSPFSV